MSTAASAPPTDSSPRVAIVHDWLIGGGAERVVMALHRMYPDAPIYTSYATDEWRQKLDSRVVTGLLQHWPFSGLRKFIPFLRIWWFMHLDLSAYDLVISSSGAEAKGFRVRPEARHINYCHAPTHYYWSRYDEYLKNPGFGVLDPLARLGLRLFVGPLRAWDYRAAQRPDAIIANSTHTAAAVRQYYGREAEVIFPPVDIERFRQATARPQPRSGYVIVGRQNPYKRFDLAVEACTQLGYPLTVIGNGPDHARLQQLAGPTITFKTDLADKEVTEHLLSAAGFIFPGLDDFGIAAVEALAAGTPVIAYKNGGALDYIQPGHNGLFFEQQSVESLVAALKEAEHTRFDNKYISESANNFSNEEFSRKMHNTVTKVTREGA